MRKATLRFLRCSLVGILALCVVVFTWIATYMVRQSDEAIRQVSSIYMSQISTQLKLHFRSVMELHVVEAAGIAKRVTEASAEGGRDAVQAALLENGESSGFAYLGLCDAQGRLETGYGPNLEPEETDELREAAARGGDLVTVGAADTGEQFLLLCAPMACPMAEGGESTALVAGLPMTDIRDGMSLDVGETLVYSHFVRKDGSFVLRNGDATEDSYFERLLTLGHFSDQTAEEALEAIRRTMDGGEDAAFSVEIAGELRGTFLTPLPYSNWYLVSVMPYGTLEEPISTLEEQRVFTTLVGGGVILLAILAVFFLYFRMTQRQMTALEEARGEAVRASLAKSEFLSNMSHDIRTPMNAIVGMTAIATANLDKPDQVRDCLKKITLSSKHLLGLINDVLDMSKIESGKLSLNLDHLSLREVMESIVNIVQPQVKAREQRFDVFIENVLTEDVYCDGVRLNQVLLNLLSNSIKFTPEGGTVHLTMRQEPSERGEDYVRVHFFVEDTGIGMSEEFQKRIFEAFEREDNGRVNKTEGTGLGMAITKYIVDAMGGEISVRSKLGEGSRFQVTVDLERAPGLEQDMSLPAWSVLVVDDDEQLCQSAADALRELGVQVECANSGAQAVEMALDRQTAGAPYQIVLLDWKMPGLDGPQTARELRSRVGGEIPILLISAYDWSSVEEEARAAGVSGFISKPLFKSTLYYALSRCMDSGQTAVAAGEEAAPDLSGKRILLAEDNDLNWEIADALLSECGLELERAENGQRCVEKFQSAPAGYYDAILMDIRMPVMNGYQAAEAIRTLERPDAADIPIIAMTADAFAEDIQRAVQSGMNDHIAKPIDLKEVLRVLQKYLCAQHMAV